MKKNQVELMVFLGLLALLAIVLVFKFFIPGLSDAQVTSINKSNSRAGEISSPRYQRTTDPQRYSDKSKSGRSQIERIKVRNEFFSAYINWGRDPFQYGSDISNGNN